MKSSNKIVAALFPLMAGAVLVGCSDERLYDDSTTGNTRIEATIDEGDALTRTCIDPKKYSNGVTGLLWTKDDQLGVYGNAGTQNAKFELTSSSNTSKGTFAGNLATDEAPQYAYYPYSADNAGKDVTALLGTVHAEQTYSQSEGTLTDDWKYGTLNGGSVGAYRFKMKHLFSMAKVMIDARGTTLEGQKLQYIELSVTAQDGTTKRNISGDFTFSAINGNYSLTGNGSNTVKMTWSDTPTLSATTYTGYLTLMPDIMTGDKIQIVVVTDQYSATYRVPCKANFQSGYIYDMPMTLTLLAQKMKEAYGEEPVIAALPTLSSLKFTVVNNKGKILDKKLVTTASSSKYSSTFQSVSEEVATIDGNTIDLVIPYLYDYNLVPTFTAAEGAVVKANGTVIESGKTKVDWANTSELEVSAGAVTNVYKVSIRNTGLPVVVIKQSTSGDFSKKYTGGMNIGSTNIGGTLVNQFVDFMVRGKDTDWVEDDQMTVYNANGTVDMVTTNCGVRLRGNSTQKLPKKPFAIKLTSKQKILGMPSHKRWCLLANWLDRSMIRNLVGFAAAKATNQACISAGADHGIIWNPSGKSVELVIDGRHVGNYLLCEQIKIGSKRLAINDCYEDLLADGKSSKFEDCGYLIEFDVMQDENYKGVTSRGITWQLKDDVLPDDYATQIRDKINAIETAIKSGDYSNYSTLIDIPSFIDAWLVLELAMNREYTEPRSIYAYMNGGSDKLRAGPVWDFDRGTFQNPSKAKEMGSKRVKSYSAFLSSSSKVSRSGGYKEDQQPCMWYPLLMDDADFVAAVKARWTILYPALQGVMGEIERLGQENALSWKYDSTMWPGTAAALNAGYPSGFSDFSGDENLTDYESVIQNLIDCYNARLEGMNTLIGTATTKFVVSETTF